MVPIDKTQKQELIVRILHVITSLRTGGAEKLMVDLLPRLRDAGHDVELLVFDGYETDFKQQLEQENVKIHDLGIGGSVYSLKRLFRLRKYLTGYDIVHTHNYAPQIFTAIRSLGLRKRTRFITTEHGGSNRRRNKKWFSLIDRWMYNRYDSVICISEKAQKNLEYFIKRSRAKILTINNGIDVKKYSSASPSTELENIAPDSRKIIMVAGFRWEKDQPTLIKTMELLPETFHLFLVGDGVRRDDYEQLIAGKGLTNRIHLLGIRNDVPQLLQASDYVVMSSHFEGLSLSSVEGMSVGKPFIASDVDGLREVVSGAGILFQHEDSKALAEEIIKLDKDTALYDSVATKCYKRAAGFDISKMAEGYINEYKRLMER